MATVLWRFANDFSVSIRIAQSEEKGSKGWELRLDVLSKRGDYGSFSIFWRVVWLMSSSRVDSAMRGLIHFLLDASECRSARFCFGFVFMHASRCHESKGNAGQFGAGLAVSELFSYRAVLKQSVPNCEMQHSQM